MARAVFTYGTLAFPDVMRAVTGRTFDSVTGTVEGHQRVGVRDAVYPGMIAAAGKATEGRVYLDVDDETLGVLDRFEDWLYERRAIVVQLEAGPVLSADAWVVPARYRGELDGAPWDSARFEGVDLDGYLAMCQAFRRGARHENGS